MHCGILRYIVVVRHCLKVTCLGVPTIRTTLNPCVFDGPMLKMANSMKGTLFLFSCKGDWATGITFLSGDVSHYLRSRTVYFSPRSCLCHTSPRSCLYHTKSLNFFWRIHKGCGCFSKYGTPTVLVFPLSLREHYTLKQKKNS